MKKPMALAVILGVVFALLTVAVILSAMSSSYSYSCEVCITFLGRSECREALGATREEATRTAVDNACGFLASGMTQTVLCTTKTRPDRTTCREN